MSTLAAPLASGQYDLSQNVEWALRDKNGNAKLIFTENKLGTAILRAIRKYVTEPIDAEGQVKPGILNYFGAYGIRIQFLTGSWGYTRRIKNLVTSAGKAGISSRINGAGGAAAFTWIAVGTGVTAAAAGDTALQTETSTSGLARVSATASQVTTSVTNDTAQLQTTFTVTGTVAVTESGILNAASSGTLLTHQVFSAVNVVNGDSLQVTWKVQAS